MTSHSLYLLARAGSALRVFAQGKTFTWVCLTAVVLLVSMRGAQAEIPWVPLQVREGAVQKVDVEAYWPDYPELLTQAGAGVTIVVGQMTTIDGRRMIATMLRAGPYCSSEGCPMRIFEDGARIVDRRHCGTVKFYLLSDDGTYLWSCKITYALANLRTVQPREATDTRSFWQQLSEDTALNHNGSVMRIRPDQGKISYLVPRDDLRPTIAENQILFQGRPWQPGGAFSGTAYTFKKGCLPAPYRVTATYEGSTETLTLRGAAPVREKGGCRVIGYSTESPNAVLSFHTTFD